jgi:hypothetical protein
MRFRGALGEASSPPGFLLDNKGADWCQGLVWLILNSIEISVSMIKLSHGVAMPLKGMLNFGSCLAHIRHQEELVVQVYKYSAEAQCV